MLETGGGESILSVPGMTGTSFAGYCASVETRLRDVYGVLVVTRPISDQLKGDLDGLEIHIDDDQTPEQRLFLLAHLFGHTVQWNTDPASFEIAMPALGRVDEKLLAQTVEYEREAASYGLSLLRECGITGIDQWYFDYSACDCAYLMHYYRTGERRAFQSFWQQGAPPLQARAIPAFTPRRKKFRLEGTVI